MSVDAAQDTKQLVLLPGQILLVLDIDSISAFKPPPLCIISGSSRIPNDQRYTVLGKNRTSSYSLFLERDAHEWLAERKWHYHIVKCKATGAILLDLQDTNRAVMFKLTWGGAIV